ncbi:Galactosyl transferase [Cordyceps fumosorosea ARSEF 2679]|uniref:Galactosyl transferase n=1 Tax=Cordyceps fumosorosea (strain ARSEF 2679) TaxID=1081104 RepID=A0A167VZP1_CORFA|nr:Galactosyl transferase [Cordyceps fumosorosea ARSEF 2679]OAA63154.1 Galactosyl transferase [Cordyceps fumosorosea ARSEF 2679]
MLATRGYGSRRFWWATITVTLLFLFFTLVYFRLTSQDILAGTSRELVILHQVAFETATKTSKPWIDFYFQRLQNPSVLPDTPKYSPFGAMEWHLPEDIAWHAGLGKDLCIIDFDDRAFDVPGQIFGPNFMSWQNAESVHGLSLGILNHWLYSKIHGYKYYYIVVGEYEDRRTSWKKPAVIAKLLAKHQACIYLDSDALFRNLDLPFEWLMNYWQLSPASNSLALAFDPTHEANQDEFGKGYLNTGFLVAQNNPRTFEVLAAWEDCPNEGGRYPECTKFRTNNPGRPTDQGGFGTYVRYDYAEIIRELPCDEANGFPEAHAGCDGTFVRHVWTGKDSLLKVFAGGQMPGPYLEYFHEEFVATKAEFLMNETELMG